MEPLTSFPAADVVGSGDSDFGDDAVPRVHRLRLDRSFGGKDADDSDELDLSADADDSFDDISTR